MLGCVEEGVRKEGAIPMVRASRDCLETLEAARIGPVPEVRNSLMSYVTIVFGGVDLLVLESGCS